MSSLSAASSSILPLHAFLLLTLLLVFATMVSSIPVEQQRHGDMNTTTTTTTTTFTNNTNSSEENFEMYVCFLCSGRDVMLIHYCPIYWDECHMICWDDIDDDTSAAAAIPAPPALPSSSDHDDCYVLKRYMSGRYVIVEHRPCKYIGECFITCGGGELAADRKAVMGGGAAAATTTTASAATTTAAALQRSFLPPVDDAELCNTQLQVNAPPSSAGLGVFVPAAAAGGAHRRRR